jgi:hypothetical protein
MELYISVFFVSGQQTGKRRLSTESHRTLQEFNLPLICFWFDGVVSTYLNFATFISFSVYKMTIKISSFFSFFVVQITNRFVCISRGFEIFFDFPPEFILLSHMQPSSFACWKSFCYFNKLDRESMDILYV